MGSGFCRVYPASPHCTPTALWKLLGFGTLQWAECRDRWRSLSKRAQKTAKVGGPRRAGSPHALLQETWENIRGGGGRDTLKRGFRFFLIIMRGQV